MSHIKKTIAFFGSGPVAAKSLELLLNHQEVEFVMTKPSTVQMMSNIAKNIPVFAVSSKKELDDFIAHHSLKSQLGVLIDFGIIVSKKVIDSFELGIINSHFSLLPEWRGADPITFSILSGQQKTGVSLMMIDEGMDTGKILTQKSLPIVAAETTPSLTHKLVLLSDSLLKEYIPRYIQGEVTPRNQPHPERATYSRKLTKEEGMLDFSKSAQQLEREIRAYQEWPKSHTEIATKDVVVLQASVDSTYKGTPGKIFRGNNKTLGIGTNDGALIIELLKPAGKKEMSVSAFLAGYGKNIPL